ncbi:MAG TPA: sulfite exporter TauE/SafE family protein [Bryobacteraceae bacterium]|nr:sulfite exporter TauE/SafE family protein [Bryobacteraceae bacterium]
MRLCTATPFTRNAQCKSAFDVIWNDMSLPGLAAIEVPAVIFIASVIRSTFGFGEALVAVPLLALIVPVNVAAPVAVLVSITIAAIAVVQDWREVHLGSAGRLVLASLVGIPLGLLLLKEVAEPIVKAVLAIVIIAFSLHASLARRHHEFTNDKLAWLFGFTAGVLGGAYGMNGPPLVIYGTLRKWSPSRFRATLQGYFLPASMIGMFGYWLAGLWTPAVSRFYLLSVPGVVLATFLGRSLNHRLNARQFVFYIHVSLIVVGVVLLSQAAAG